jgi:bDLD-like protein
MSFNGQAKLEFVQRLSDSWRDLADLLEVSTYERATFRTGDEARCIWEWLDNRGRLAGLPDALEGIDRSDLADTLLANKSTGRSGSHAPFEGKFAQLRSWWLNPKPVFDRVDVDQLFGREQLLDDINRFIRERDRGYILIEAAAGLGKTAVAAWLARTRHYICHFTDQPRGGESLIALRNIGAQLIARLNLSEFVDDKLPQMQDVNTSWLYSILERAAAVAERRLVIVVDGLDKGEAVDGALPLGLPTRLPPGVVIVGTFRSGAPVSPGSPSQILKITAVDRNNLHGVQAFLEASAASEPFSSILRSQNFSTTDFVRLTAESVNGHWLLLRYILDEIRLGLRDVPSANLPTDLLRYYADQLASLREDRRLWSRALLPLLSTLAVAREPLTLGTLTNLAGLKDRDKHIAAEFCSGPWRPFLTAAVDGSHQKWSIYHSSLIEFLNGVAGEEASTHAIDLASELATATADAHSRISDRYLCAYGGLDRGMSKLTADLSRAALDDGYALRHLTRHLSTAGRNDEVHRLLHAQYRTSNRDLRNVWYDAQDLAGSVDAYLLDIELARSIAEQDTDDALKSGVQADNLGLEVRYAVISASIAGVHGQIPLRLLRQLVVSRYWSIDKAIARIQHFGNPRDRAEAYTALLTHVPDTHRDDVAGRALSAIEETGAEFQRAHLLEDLAPRLPGDLLDRAHAVANSVQDGSARAWALIGLAPRLPEPRRAAVFKEALSLIGTQVPDGNTRARAIEDIAPNLPVTLLTQALRIATEILEPVPPSSGYGGPHAGSSYPHERICGGLPRIRALAALAVRWERLEQNHVFEEALREVSNVGGDYRAEALKILAPVLPEELIDRAVTLTRAMRRSKAWALAFLSARRPTLVREAIEAIGTISPHDNWELVGSALPILLAHITDPERSTLAGRALAAAQDISLDHDSRARAIAALLPFFPEQYRTEIVEEALSKPVDVSWLLRQVSAITTFLPFLAPATQSELTAQAFAIAARLDEPGERNWAIGALSSHLPAPVLGRALQIVGQISDEVAVSAALHAASRQLSPERQVDLMKNATDTASQIIRPYERCWTLAVLLPDVTEDNRAELAEQILTTAAGFIGTDIYARLLTSVAGCLPSERRRELFLQAVNDIDPESQTVTWTLRRLAEGLPTELLAGLLDRIRRFDDSSGYGRAAQISALAAAPHLPDEILRAAGDLAREIDDQWQASALLRLAKHLPEDRRKQVVGQIDFKFSDNVSVSLNVEDLSEPQRVAIFAEFTRRSEFVNEYNDLITIAPYLRGAALENALGELRKIYCSKDDRVDILIAFAKNPELPPDRLDELLKEAVRAAAEIATYPNPLAALAPFLPERLPGIGVRESALRSVATALPDDLIAWALDSAEDLDREAEIAVVTALAGRMAEIISPKGAVRLLRRNMRNTSRRSLLGLIASSSRLINQVGGQRSIEQYACTVRTVGRWYP